MDAIRRIERSRLTWTAPIRRYERHLSAAAMVLGFALDNVTFGRVDHPGAHIVLTAYLAVAIGSIAIAHALQARKDREAARLAALLSSKTLASQGHGTPDAVIALRVPPQVGAGAPVGVAETAQSPERRSRLRVWIPAATQFALGGLWSAFLVFYSRSAVLAASWPFLLLLLGFLIGNEAFRRYHARLVFASLLLFFALYSYAVFVVPVFTKTIGLATFLASGALAIAAYWLFLRLLSMLGRARYRQSRWKLVGGAAAITTIMNAFYFTGLLPPLPLALSDVGIYHGIRHLGPVYEAQTESEPWMARVGLARPVIHVVAGQKLELYSAVFAPIKMTTRITHRWQLWDAQARRWRTQSEVSFAIAGGRGHGYRGYSIKSDPKPGDWRVDIDSEDGRLIGRVAFTVAQVTLPIETTTKVLQ